MQEKPEPKEVIGVGSKIGYTKAGNTNFGGMEFQPIGWGYFELTNDNGVLQFGLKTIKYFPGRIKLPPYDLATLPKDPPSEIEFTVVEYYYDKADVDKLARERQRANKKPPEEIKKEKRIDPGQQDVQISNEPYVQNSEQQWIDRPFAKGYGIDFYLDGARFLPDNVTVTKAIVRVVTDEYKEEFPPVAALPRFGEGFSTYSPIYDFRYEYRAEFFHPTSMMLITLLTFDKDSSEVRIVGYGAINLFINRYTGLQPTDVNDSDIVLFNGAYQIPIFSQEPLRTRPFNMEKMGALDRMPCASILVRIMRAPMTDDWIRVLSKNDIPKHLWRQKGIWPKRP